MQAGFGVKNHSHEYYHLLSIIEGRMDFIMSDSRYEFHPGDTILVPQGYLHRFENNTKVPVRYYEIKFTVLNRGLNKILSACIPEPLHDEFTYQLVAHIVGEYLENRMLKDDSATAMLATLIYHITKDFRQSDQENSFVIDTTGYSALSQKVVNFLAEHFSENLSLDDISKGVGITKTYLCNAFKKNTGMTIVDCLNMIRVRKAAELIVYSDLPLAQVAEKCGYVSPSHFNRIFVRYVGLPPGQCRKAYTYDMLLKENEVRRQADSFMYSVLGQKSIPPALINIIEGHEEDRAQD